MGQVLWRHFIWVICVPRRRDRSNIMQPVAEAREAFGTDTVSTSLLHIVIYTVMFSLQSGLSAWPRSGISRSAIRSGLRGACWQACSHLSVSISHAVRRHPLSTRQHPDRVDHPTE